jgi:hypothetical protein
MDDCEAQITSYLRFRAQLLEKYATLGCMTHQDCTIYFEKNACHIGCGLVIPNAAIQFLEPNLQSFAAQTCTPGCAPIPLPCEPPGDPFCVNGICQ